MRQRWLLLMAVLLPLSITWALTNPMFASPDEPAHMARAQGFARLDFDSPYETDGLPMDAPNCFRLDGTKTADCADYTWGVDGTEVDPKTRDYPPLFHAVAAVPAVFIGGFGGAYVMRLWMAVVCCSLIALAGALAIGRDRGRWPVVGVTIALTPMALFVSSMVNPSGITFAFASLVVAGAIARWVHGDGSRLSAAAMLVGAPGLLLVRRDSILWVVIVAASMAPLAWSRPEIRRRLTVLDPRRWRLGTKVASAVALLVIVVAASLWVVPVVHRFFTTGEVEGNGSRWQGIEVMRIYFDHMIGTFGWIDTYIGPEAFAVASSLCILVVLLGFASGRRPLLVSQSVALAALFVTPVVFGMFLYPYFQGRYLLPIWVIVAMVSCHSIGTSDVSNRTLGRLASVVVFLWGVVHVWSLVQNLRRYTVGFRGTWWFASEGVWHPPMMSNTVAIVFIAVASMASALAMRRLLAVSRV